MNDLKAHWDKSSATIPDDKDPSNYAIDTEALFPRGAVVCDLGGGAGTDSLYFASKGHKVLLVDVSDYALEQARSAAGKRNLKGTIETYPCNLEDGHIPLPTNSCDIVYSRLTLHYFKLDLLSKLLLEIYRMLKPGGQAFLTLKSPDDKVELEYLLSNAVQVEDGVFNEGGFIKTRFSTKQLELALEMAGIPSHDCSVQALAEKLGGRKDKIKSGNSELLVNVIQMKKCSQTV